MARPGVGRQRAHEAADRGNRDRCDRQVRSAGTHQRARSRPGRARRNSAAARLRAQDLARVRHHQRARSRREQHAEHHRPAGTQRARRSRVAARLRLRPILESSGSGNSRGRTPARARSQEDGRRRDQAPARRSRRHARRWRTKRTRSGLRIAHHVGVEETNAWDDIRLGTTSIEHWYGIPDAAIKDGVQNFPSSYNYNNEVDRFRWAGHLWREADPERLSAVAPGNGGQERRVGADARHLRSEPRSAARADAALVQGLPASDARGILPARIRTITARTSSAGRRPTRRSGRRTIASG